MTGGIQNNSIMKIKNFLWCALAVLTILSSCSDNDDDLKIEEELKNIHLELGKEITLNPDIGDGISGRWKMNDEIVSEQRKYTFKASKLGLYEIYFEAEKYKQAYEIRVYQIRKGTKESSAYLAKLIEYKPAPGQFMNKGYGLMKDAESIIGKPEYGMVSLGGFGGYIIAGFDHTILNLNEQRDLAVYANAFDGSSEPGIVMVSLDYNGNGKADDEWFELAGSEYNAKKTIHNYEITYTNPKGYKDVPWTDNQGNSGVVKINKYNTQPYYPNFIPEQESVTFKGTLLENKTDLNYDHPKYGNIVWNPHREWGYADNYSSEYNDLKANTFDFDWAVNNKGEKVNLPGIDFIKIYTSTNVDGGALGENSTEIMGVADLSMLD
jgi:hypothetical protein